MVITDTNDDVQCGFVEGPISKQTVLHTSHDNEVSIKT